MILHPDFAPDRSRYAIDATSVIVNCLPIADRWGPMPALVEVSEALPSACRGAISVRSLAGSWVSFAGTTTKLYKLDTTDYSFDDYTRLVGGDYNVPSTDRWCFKPIGSTLVATNINDVVQYIDIDSGTNFAALPGSPPQAKYAESVSEFLVLGHLANLPNFVQWSEVGNIEGWTRGVNGAGRQELASGGEVQGVFAVQGGAYVFCRSMIHAMTLTWDAGSFRFDVVNSARGAISPLCIVPIAPGKYFYLAEDGFYIFDGQGDTAIGFERVDRWFLDGDSLSLASEVDRQNLADTRGFLDPFRKVVWVQYPKSTGGYGLLGYNFALAGRDGKPGRWFMADFSVEEIVSLATAGVTIGGLQDMFGTVGAIDVPFGSRLLTGGKPTIGAFTSGHKLAYFTGGNLAATIESADIQLTPGRRSALYEVGLGGEFDPADITIQVGTKGRQGESLSWSSAYPMQADSGGQFMTGDDGRYHRVRVTIPADSVWTSHTGIEEERCRFNATGRA